MHYITRKEKNKDYTVVELQHHTNVYPFSVHVNEFKDVGRYSC